MPSHHNGPVSSNVRRHRIAPADLSLQNSNGISMTTELKPFQSEGMNYLWGNADGSFRQLFLKLNPTCELDPYSGIVIIAGKQNKNAKAFYVKVLQREFPKLLAKYGDIASVHWRIERDEEKAMNLLAKLSDNPVFVG